MRERHGTGDIARRRHALRSLPSAPRGHRARCSRPPCRDCDGGVIVPHNVAIRALQKVQRRVLYRLVRHLSYLGIEIMHLAHRHCRASREFSKSSLCLRCSIELPGRGQLRRTPFAKTMPAICVTRSADSRCVVSCRTTEFTYGCCRGSRANCDTATIEGSRGRAV